tara:strand:- start:133 stop:747 length:615 start_codon:yes stop_codon:yes gene_type:complete
MTVTELRAQERKAPAPKAGSYVHSIYETIDALGGTATCAEVRELLPAAGGRQFATNKDTHNHVNSLAVHTGYVVLNEKFSTRSNANITDDDYGRAVYRIASAEHYENRRRHLLARAQTNQKRRERTKQRLEARQAAEAEQSRMNSALQKLTAKTPKPDAPVPVTSVVTPPTVAPQPLSRTEVALITGAACFISVSAYALLEQFL